MPNDDDYLPGMEAPMQTFFSWWGGHSTQEKYAILLEFLDEHDLLPEWEDYRKNIWRNGR